MMSSGSLTLWLRALYESLPMHVHASSHMSTQSDVVPLGRAAADEHRVPQATYVGLAARRDQDEFEQAPRRPLQPHGCAHAMYESSLLHVDVVERM